MPWSQDHTWLIDAAEHLFAIVRAPLKIPAGLLSSNSWTLEKQIDPPLLVQMSRGHVADEFLRYPDLPDRVRLLTREVLEPIVMTRRRHNYFIFAGTERPGLRPFLATADGHVLAGRYKRRSGAEVWLLPDDVPDIVPWVRAAIAEWHHLAPDRFPGLPDWSHESSWQTQTERGRVAALATLDAERRHIADHLDRRMATLRRSAGRRTGGS
jgi:hypothetical protein